MTEESPHSPSGPPRWVLRADAVTSSRVGIMVVILILLGLVFTGSSVGYAAAAVLFLAWVCVGAVGKRHATMSRRTSATKDR
ncbi:hypothetical protein ACLGI4_05015 [Streptomyces sp. HMX112]|uniref:hypothetical protein n=1 Tax=Streptomyces sp. HMX112 TaxID=3390850 RepID=UPI003A7F6F2D